jgi:hypothetical protein
VHDWPCNDLIQFRSSSDEFDDLIKSINTAMTGVILYNIEPMSDMYGYCALTIHTFAPTLFAF